MPRVRFDVEVEASESLARSRFVEAADNPAMVVAWFTSAESVRAEVKEREENTWTLRVNGPGFAASGTAGVANPGLSSGSTIGIDINVSPKGLLGGAAVLAAVATGQLETEIKKALWKEFGKPHG
ncbi:MAG: hypothetical protein ACI8TP_000677 [Acidimicrobiales bacterium]